LVNKTSSFAVTEDNKYLAEVTFPSFITEDMIDIEVIDETRTLIISTHFKDDNGSETSSATVERLPDDADIISLTATFDKGKLTLIMDKLMKETTPKTINVCHK
jgi:HSP20 family molecular chaperone IbpA